MKHECQKISRKREEVFTARVLDKLYPSENEQDEASIQQLSAKNSSRKHTKADPKRPPDVAKVYTVHLPPEGLPEALKQASCEDLDKDLRPSGSESVSSVETDDDNRHPRKRKRKRKHRRKVSNVGDPTEILPSNSRLSSTHDNLNPPRGTNQELQAQRLPNESSSQRVEEAQPLTKNQKKKLRKKRAKLGKPRDQQPKRATEFTYDADEQGPGRGERDASDDEDGSEEIAGEVKEFMEAVWRVFSCDGTKAKTASSQARLFQSMIGQLTDNQLPQETLILLRDVKNLLVLQDFTRARLRLTELGENLGNTSQSVWKARRSLFPMRITKSNLTK